MTKVSESKITGRELAHRFPHRTRKDGAASVGLGQRVGQPRIRNRARRNKSNVSVERHPNESPGRGGPSPVPPHTGHGPSWVYHGTPVTSTATLPVPRQRKHLAIVCTPSYLKARVAASARLGWAKLPWAVRDAYAASILSTPAMTALRVSSCVLPEDSLAMSACTPSAVYAC